MGGIFKSIKRDEIFILAVIILVAAAAFGLGRLSITTAEKEAFSIIYPGEVKGAVLSDSQAPTSPAPSSGAYVASKTGARYHLPWCAGAQSIKPENKVYFDTKEAAEAAGYTAAGNCKGL